MSELIKYMESHPGLFVALGGLATTLGVVVSWIIAYFRWQAKRTPASSSLGFSEILRKRKRLWLALAGTGAVLLTAGIVFFWPTAYGVIRIEINDPSVQVVFDTNGPTIKGADKEPISLRAGTHGLTVKRGDFTFETDKILIKKNETLALKVELLNGKLQVTADGRVIGTGDPPIVVGAVPPGRTNGKIFKNSLGMEFALIPKGKAWLGGTDGNVGDQVVEIPHDFYLGVYEVTQEEWVNVMGKNPSGFTPTGPQYNGVKGISAEELKRFPVERMSWQDCQEFVKAVNELVKKDVDEKGWVYRLPKEVEWEYACRGGPGQKKVDYRFDFYLENATNTLPKDKANFRDAGKKRPEKVGSYPPNRLGLHDMHGNVWEWCDDPDGSRPITRGGCFDNEAYHCRAASRIDRDPVMRGGSGDVGLRLARVPVAGK